MLDWSEIRVAKEQREFMVEQAEASRHLLEGLNVGGSFQSAVNWVASRLGAWLINLGLRLQSRSVEMAERMQRVQAGSVNQAIHQAEQNC